MGTIATATPADKRSPQRLGTRIVWEGQITMTSSYATGGDTLNAKTLGMNQIDGAWIEPVGATLLQGVIQTDRSSVKVKATVSNTGAEVANTTSQTTVVANARFVGR